MPITTRRSGCFVQNYALWYRQFGDPVRTLQLEISKLPSLADGVVRARMNAAPINPSDLIPITGAYRHRVAPPRIAGYEGVGTVVDAAGHANLTVGQRILPLRGPGTWQTYIDTDPEWIIPVPDHASDAAAVQGYINPLTALLMLRKWPVRGKHVLLTAAGSSCANLLAQWAFAEGARSVAGIYRSAKHVPRLLQIGVTPIDAEAFGQIASVAAHSDTAFDAVGGTLASRVLTCMKPGASFISYGLLSGSPFAVGPSGPAPQRFHLRDHIATAAASEWRNWFREIWPRLARSRLPDISPYRLNDWKDALALFYASGRASKPVLKM